MQSIVTDRFQTTIPKEIREKLKLKKSDRIEWEISPEGIRISRIENPLLSMQGMIQIGSGNIEQDIEAAQESRLRKRNA